MSDQAILGKATLKHPQLPPLISYCVRGLHNCWLPLRGRWSHTYHLDGRAQPNESVPASDVFYTLNVLLGLSQIRHLSREPGFNLRDIFNANVTLVPRLKSRAYAYGMALWTAAALQVEIPPEPRDHIVRFINNRRNWRNFTAQDLGLVLVGCVAQAQLGSDCQGMRTAANDLFALLLTRYSHPSGLFFDTAAGPRKLFSSFATNTYLTLAGYIFGEWSGDERAILLSNACAKKLIELQGPQGEWPWFFYTPAARVVDFYEVYSVHQHGMAPAFLEYAEKHGVRGATDALVKGFHWILGQNELKISMLWKREGLICRSFARTGELTRKRKRVVRSIANALVARPGRLAGAERVTLRLECRSYELGWILWSFGRRSDLSRLTHHPEFA